MQHNPFSGAPLNILRTWQSEPFSVHASRKYGCIRQTFTPDGAVSGSRFHLEQEISRFPH